MAPPPLMKSRTTKDQPERPPSGYRFSDTFIRRSTVVLVTVMLGGFGAGLCVSAVTGEATGDVAETVGSIATALMAVSLLVPLVVAVFMGGQAIHRHGWALATALIVGMGVACVGVSSEQPVAAWAGLFFAVLAVAGFFYLGLRARALVRP